MSLIETIGARIVLTGQKEYVAGVKEAGTALKTLADSGKTVAASSADMQAATERYTAARKVATDADRQAAAAAKELSAANTAVTRAEAEDAAASDKTTQATLAKAKARQAAATAAKAEADTAATAATTEATAAKADADAVAAAEAKKSAARDAGLKVAKVGLLGLGAATAVVGVASVKMANDFQTQLTRLYTAAGAPKQAILDNSNAILQLGTQVGMTGTQMAEALYHPISAGLDLATSMNVVKESAKEAQISGASLDDTTYSLSSVMKAFNQPADQAAKTMAELNAIVGEGDMKFQDFNGSIKNWAPTAAQMGLSVTSMGAGLAYLTDRGNDATTAATRLTMGISMMTTPSAQAAKLLEGMGVASGDVSASSAAMTQVLQQTHITQNQLAKDLQQPDGLYVALQHLKDGLDKAGVSGTEADSVLAKIFGGGRSDKAILSLIQNLDGLHQKFEQISDKSTTQAFEQNWDDVQKTFGFQAKALGATLENLGIRIGTALLPALTKLMAGLQVAIGWLEQHKAVAEAVAYVVGTLMVFAFLALADVMAGKLVTAIGAVGKALITLVAENPILAIIALVAGAALLIITHWQQVSAFFVGLWNGIKSVASTVWNWITSTVSSAASAIMKFFKPVTDFFRSVWGGIVSFFTGIWNGIVSVVMLAVHKIEDFFAPVVNNIRSHWGEIQTVTQTVWAIIVGILRGAWAVISGIFKVAAAILGPLIAGLWAVISTGARIAWALISGVIGAAWDEIKSVVMTGIAVVKTILDVAWNVIRTAVTVAWDAIKMVFQVVWDIISTIFKVARDTIMAIIDVFLDIVTGNWSRAWTDIKDFVVNIWNDIWGGIKGIAEDIWHGLQSIFDDLWHGLVGTFTNLWNDIKGVFVSGVNTVIHIVDGFLDVVNKVAGALGFSINLHIDPIGLESGGIIPVRMLAEGGALDNIFTTVGQGFKTNGPRAIVGEGNQNFPEYVIPTDPAYRRNAMSLTSKLLQDLGLDTLGDIGLEGSIDGGVQPYARGGSLPVRGGDGASMPVRLLAAGGSLGAGGSSSAGAAVPGLSGVSAGGSAIATESTSSPSFWDDIVGMFTHGAKWLLDKIWPELPVDPNSLMSFVPGIINGLRDKVGAWLDKENSSADGSAAGGAGAGAALAFAKSQVGKPYVWGAVGPDGYDCSGFMSAITNVLRGRNPFSRVGSTGSAPWPGFQDGAVSPLFTIGYSRDTGDGIGHMAGTLLGQSVESAGGVGVRMNGLNAFSSLFPNRMAFRAESGAILPASARSAGGPVMPSSSYMIGEDGPEMFIPQTAGTVVPADISSALTENSQSQGTPEGLFGGGDIVIQPGAIVIQDARDPKATADMVLQRIADKVARR